MSTRAQNNWPNHQSPAITRRGVLMGVLGLAASILAATAGQITSHSRATRRAYAQLGSAHARHAGKSAGHTPDFDTLSRINLDIAGWLSIPSVDISLPVVQEKVSNQTSLYLTHDFWGTPSFLGCPFIDTRSSADAIHILIYGHFDASSPQSVFGPIHNVHEQEMFDQVRAVHLDTPRQGRRTYTPLMSMRVDASYEPIQTFDFGQLGSLEHLKPPAVRHMLQTLSRDASARASHTEDQLREAQSVLSLVTCASVHPNTPWRTILICTSP